MVSIDKNKQFRFSNPIFKDSEEESNNHNNNQFRKSFIQQIYSFNERERYST